MYWYPPGVIGYPTCGYMGAFHGAYGAPGMGPIGLLCGDCALPGGIIIWPGPSGAPGRGLGPPPRGRPLLGGAAGCGAAPPGAAPCGPGAGPGAGFAPPGALAPSPLGLAPPPWNSF